jgi:PAS domain S-box-containing protein
MPAESKHTDDEIKRLQGCINDLISIQALPAIWSGQDSSHIAGTLLDVLVRVLSLDFAYARLNDSIDCSPIEFVRLAQRRNPPPQPRMIGRALDRWLTNNSATAPLAVPNPLGAGEVKIAPFRLGLQEKIGVLVAGSKRADFPTETEILLLRTAANQAVVALHEARQLSEQKRATEELERRVLERTEQLGAVNEALRKEIVERKRTEEDRRKLVSLVENSPDFIGIASLEGRALFVISAGQKLVGLDGDEEVRASRMLDYIAEPERERFQREILAAVQREGQWEGETQFGNFQTGAAIHMLHHIFFIREEESDRPIAFATVSRDITQRKQAEEALRASEERFRRYFDLGLIGMTITSPAKGCLEVNDELCRILGYERSELLRKTWAEMTHPDDLAADVAQFNRVMAGEINGYSMDKRWIRKDGRVIDSIMAAQCLRRADGSVDYFVGLVLDTTERKRAQEALNELQAELAHVTRVSTLGELAASIAHEVNQPLAAVVTNGNAGVRWLAAATPNVDEAREAFGRIIRDGNRASAVIARIRALLTKTIVEKEPLDVNEAIEDIMALAQGEVRRNGVLLRTELAGDLPPVLGDRVQLQQVVLNLIINGIEAMSAVEDRCRELVVTTQKDQVDKVRISVQDFGIGLDSQTIERIFDAFYTTKRDGMGMGLSISRSIIEAHGGRLWATANDGPGATLHFTLPCGVADAP